MTRHGKHQSVGILPIEGFTLLSYACVVDPLRFANLLSGQLLYDLVVIGRDATKVESSGPAFANVSQPMRNDINLDYLLVIAGGRPERFEDAKTLNWIARMSRKKTCIGGVSGGPVILAKAGVVSGHRITVHWEHAPALLEAFPDLLLEKTLFTRDRQIITCGGGAAALDMTLAMIENDHGSDLMRRVSEWCLHTDIREGTDAQREATFNNVGAASGAVLRTVKTMEDNIASPVSLSELASLAGYSERQLNRIFKRSTGKSAIQYYRHMRLDFALNLLRSSTLSITEIALATGFSSSSHFATAFRARYRALPLSFRA